MKFKIELEAVSPREKALTPIMKIRIESKHATPETVKSIFDQVSWIMWNLKVAINKLHEKPS